MNSNNLSAAALETLEEIGPEELKKVRNEYNESSDAGVFPQNALIGIVGLSSILLLAAEFSDLGNWGLVGEAIALTVLILAIGGIVKKIGHRVGYLQGYREGHRAGAVKALGNEETNSIRL